MQKLLTFLSLWLTLSAICLCDREEEFARNGAACMNELRTNKTELELVLAGEIKGNNISEKIKCHYNCVLEKDGALKAGVINQRGAIELVMALDHTSEANSTKAVQACANLKGTSNCDLAFKMLSCMFNSFDV